MADENYEESEPTVLILGKWYNPLITVVLIIFRCWSGRSYSSSEVEDAWSGYFDH